MRPVDKRPNIAGNIYTKKIEGINVHKYGAHIFHTNNKKVWNYITQFAEFNRFTNSPVANYKGELYSLPFNMYTFNKMWAVVTPARLRSSVRKSPTNRRIWRNRPSPSLAETFTKNSSRAIPRSSGAVTVRSFLRSSSSVYLCG